MYPITTVFTRKKDLAALIERREEIREKIRSPASAQIRTGRTDRNTESRTERLYAALDEVNNKIFDVLDEMITAREEIAKKIERMKIEKHKEVLFDRYIKCMKFTDIAAEMNTDKRFIYRLHKAALAEWKELE